MKGNDAEGNQLIRKIVEERATFLKREVKESATKIEELNRKIGQYRRMINLESKELEQIRLELISIERALKSAS